jgi:hypothetical protein
MCRIVNASEEATKGTRATCGEAAGEVANDWQSDGTDAAVRRTQLNPRLSR